MTREDLVQRLSHHEDNFIERKLEGAANRSEIRRTVVAFSNSVPDGRTAILYIGVAEDGTPVGVSNPDSLQKAVREVTRKDCYPEVKNYSVEVLEISGKHVLAVIVGSSNSRPHFSGSAFVRKGSETVAASSELYEELIASRNTKAGKILRHKGEIITFKTNQTYYGVGRSLRGQVEIECRIEGCDAHVVDLYDIGSGRHISESLERIRINKDPRKNSRLMIEVVDSQD